jgi:ribosome-interacting GTPase 1
VPALTRINGVLVQLVEIPGLIAGASEGHGGGRALIGVLRSADAIVLCHDASAPPDELRVVLAELEAAGVEKPSLLAATTADEARPEALAGAFPGLDVLGVSVLDDDSLEAFRQAVWGLTGLVRVFLRSAGENEEEPVALHPPVTVLHVADSIHHELAARCVGARVWGPSARFDGQRVGREHELSDGDAVEILD